MSTHLQFHRDLPKLRITSSVNIDDLLLPSPHPITPLSVNVDVVAAPETKIEKEDAVVNEEDESYRTPTSKESKIPAILTCPPAPKKPKAFVSCKRKLMDQFQFFEVSNNEDMDAFFRSTFPKRTCPCT